MVTVRYAPSTPLGSLQKQVYLSAAHAVGGSVTRSYRQLLHHTLQNRGRISSGCNWRGMRTRIKRNALEDKKFESFVEDLRKNRRLPSSWHQVSAHAERVAGEVF